MGVVLLFTDQVNTLHSYDLRTLRLQAIEWRRDAFAQGAEVPEEPGWRLRTICENLIAVIDALPQFG